MKRHVAMKVCAVFAALVVFGVVEVAEADYVIYLRDGKQYVVDTFSVRGDIVGPLGIEKNRVAVIHDRETGENIIFNRFHTTQAYEAFRKSQEAQVRLRGKEPTCGEEKEPAKANYKIVQQDDLSYQGVGKVVMLQFRIQIAESMSEAELCHICKDIVGGQKQPYNAIRCWFYLPDSDTRDDYTAGESVWAPNGTWEDADDVRTGNYSEHSLVTLMGKRSDHIERDDETPLFARLTETETIVPPLSETETIGVSYYEVMAYLSDFFSMERSPLLNGQNRYLGTSRDGTAALEIIGDKNDISKTTLLVGLPNDSNAIVAKNSLFVLRFLKNTVPEWANSAQWVGTAMRKFADNRSDSARTVKGNKAIEMKLSRAMGLVTVTVKHR